MVQIKVFVLLFILLLTNAQAVYNPGYYGEKDFDLFYGVGNPDYKVDEYYGRVIWKDNELNKGYMDLFIEQKFGDLKNFFNNHLYQAMTCPNSAISQHYDYYRFINRLIAMSYIFESMRRHEYVARRLNQRQSCRPDWDNIIKRCKGTSKDMKLFLQNVGMVVRHLEPVLVSSDVSKRKYQTQWLEDYTMDRFKDVTHHRLKQHCNQIGCYGLSLPDVGKHLKTICKEDEEFFVQICSEKDHLYGMSKIPEVYHLLVNSEILNAVNKEGFAMGCLRRFTQQMKHQEVHSPVLKSIFPILYSTLSRDENVAYDQGELFPAGSMREFMDKGLTAVFTDQTIEKKVAMLKPAPIQTKPEPIRPEPKPKKIVKKKKKKKKKVVKKKRKKKKIPKVRKSSFLIASEFRKTYDLETSKVDMLKFKYDYIFTLEVLDIMKEQMGIYMTRKSLEQMKQHDKLGTSDGPVPLLFIKYMIDQNQHQGLYNMISILGNKFYVKNNIDGKLASKYDYVEIRNDETTDFQWQLFVNKDF
jgi:hypothetical protein